MVKNDHIFTESRTCQRIASEHGVGEKTVRRAEKYSQGIDAAEEAVPGAQEEILTGRIKATDAQIAALPAIPKEERPAILDELRKEKGKRNENLLSRLKPERPPPKSAPPKPPEPPQNEEPAAPEPVTPSPPEEEIEPASNGPPSFLQKIQGHKRHLSEEDMVRLKASVDSRYADMEPHIGSEQGGKRPVVVLQNNIGNRHSPTLIVATVTTRTEKKKNQPTHVLVDSNPAFEEPSMILLEQIFTIDKSRIERFMGYASKAEMLRIDMALLVSLALNVLSGKHSE